MLRRFYSLSTLALIFGGLNVESIKAADIWQYYWMGVGTGSSEVLCILQQRGNIDKKTASGYMKELRNALNDPNNVNLAWRPKNFEDGVKGSENTHGCKL
tara:strand:- start:435 stop:734 length:300 start_codon:yes stop_codon:yes gene_type:complete